jgi:predicted RNA-binding Zn-ribbon protein involved in translation (DUF1610 family)
MRTANAEIIWNLEVKQTSELIVCPKCKKPTMIMEKIFAKREITEIPLEEFVKKELANERNPPQIYSGDMSLYIGQKATQLFFKCTTCGYIEIHNI